MSGQETSGKQEISGKPDKRPLVLVEKERGAMRLAALDPSAAQLNLVPGMSLADARALVPDLAVEEIDRQKDDATLSALAQACERFTPLVARDGGNGLVLDVTGCALLFGGEAGILEAVRRMFLEAGFSVRGAMARTPDAAHAFVRFTRGGIVQAGAEEAVARRLPVTALEADHATTIALTRAGFRTLGDLADRPSQTLTARFGASLQDRLRRIMGHEDMRITPVRTPPAIMAERHFPEPFTAGEKLLAVLERLAGDVSGLLEMRSEGGRVFEASFFRSDGAVRRLTIETAQGLRDPQTLIRLFKLRIDALADPVDPGFGFDAIRLAVRRSEPLEIQQEDMAGRKAALAEDPQALAALADRLIARFGRDNVLRFITRDSHDPVRAATAAPYLSATGSSSLVQEQGLIQEQGEENPDDPPARPLTLFTHPQPVDVIAEVPDGPPLRFRWRRVLHEVTRAEGPERIAPEWWRGGDATSATRDYYRIEDSGGHRFWIFRTGLYATPGEQPRWFLHGLFA